MTIDSGSLTNLAIFLFGMSVPGLIAWGVIINSVRGLIQEVRDIKADREARRIKVDKISERLSVIESTCPRQIITCEKTFAEMGKRFDKMEARFDDVQDHIIDSIVTAVEAAIQRAMNEVKKK